MLKLTWHWSVIGSDRTVPVLKCLYGQRLRSYYFVAKPNQQFFANVGVCVTSEQCRSWWWIEGVVTLIPPVTWEKNIYTLLLIDGHFLLFILNCTSFETVWLNFISQRWRWLAQRLTHVSAVATVLLMTKTITVKYYYSRAVLCHRVYHNFVRTQTPHDIAPKGYVQGTQLSFGGFKMYCPWTVEGSLLLTVCGAWLKPLHWESS